MPTRPTQPYRCINCRTRFAAQANRVKHERHCLEETCRCGGYPWPHRAHSPCCDSHPLAPLNRAARDGADNMELLDIAAGMAFDGLLPSNTECPF